MVAHALVADSAVFRAKLCEPLQGVCMAPASHLPPSPDKCLSMLSGKSSSNDSGQSLSWKGSQVESSVEPYPEHKVCLRAAIQGIKNSKAPVSNGVPVAA